MSQILEKVNGNKDEQQNGGENGGTQNSARHQNGCIEVEGCSQEKGRS